MNYIIRYDIALNNEDGYNKEVNEIKEGSLPFKKGEIREVIKKKIKQNYWYTPTFVTLNEKIIHKIEELSEKAKNIQLEE